MKKLLIILFVLFYSENYSQEIADLKDYISEIIDANDPTRSYDNYALFNDDVLKVHAEGLIGRSITLDVFENLFIYGFELHNSLDKSGEILLTEAQIIDFRGISKISTTRVGDKNKYYFKVNIYLNPNYLSIKYSNPTSEQITRLDIDMLEIYISDNQDGAVKIKKAFLKIGELSGFNIIDGDFF